MEIEKIVARIDKNLLNVENAITNEQCSFFIDLMALFECANEPQHSEYRRRMYEQYNAVFSLYQDTYQKGRYQIDGREARYITEDVNGNILSEKVLNSQLTDEQIEDINSTDFIYSHYKTRFDVICESIKELSPVDQWRVGHNRTDTIWLEDHKNIHDYMMYGMGRPQLEKLIDLYRNAKFIYSDKFTYDDYVQKYGTNIIAPEKHLAFKPKHTTKVLLRILKSLIEEGYFEQITENEWLYMFGKNDKTHKIPDSKPQPKPTKKLSKQQLINLMNELSEDGSSVTPVVKHYFNLNSTTKKMRSYPRAHINGLKQGLCTIIDKNL